MKNDTRMHYEIDDVYHATAKKLYHIAFYAVGDPLLAEQTALGVFADAFDRLKDTSDTIQFEKQCYTLLYRYMKKFRLKSGCHICCETDGLSEHLPCIADHKQLSAMLTGLDFEERYIVLLFCLQKYSVRQIAKITHLPCFLIEKHLVAAVGKAITA